MRARTAILLGLGLLAAVPAWVPARAQVLGARPGYANATLKPEQRRQRLEAAQRRAAQQAAAQQAAEQEAQKKK